MARPLIRRAVLAALILTTSPLWAAGGDDALKKGNDLVQKGRLDDAIQIYRKAAESHPKNAKLHLTLGLSLANKGEAVEAARHLRASVQIEPTYQGWYSLGLVYASRNAFTEAVEAYQQALRLNPRAYRAWYQLGLVHSAQAQFDSALEAYGKSIEMNPQFEEGYLGLGSAYFWSGDRDAAKRQVERMKLLKMKDKAAALESWIKKKEESNAPAPAAEPARPAPEVQAGQAA
jgi:tetratricopeptide (TPR) repeat protein